MSQLNINNLNLEQKIGQMFMFGFFGDTVSENLKYLINEKHLGNVIVFARNIRNARALQNLTRDIYSEFDIPPLIGIDQEGGVVTRITEGATLMPGNMAVASTGDPGLAEEYGRIIGRELRSLGINLNLAPVLDVNRQSNPGLGVRSFGETPEKVIEYGSKLIEGLQSEKIFTTGKHFPGIGAAALDTHLDMPAINLTIEELEETDIPPFHNAIENGIDCLMTSHAAFPAFLPESDPVPATFSKEIMTDYLRGKLGFKGVLITDDLEMGAAEKSMSFADSILTAVKAGADLLCVCHDFDKQKLAIDSVLDAVRSGDIPESKIDESVERILELKNRFIKNREMFFSEDINKHVDEHSEAAAEIVNSSIQICSRPDQILPGSNAGKALVILPRLKEYTKVEELKSVMEKAEQALITETGRYIENIEHIKYTLPPSEEEISEILIKCRESDSVIFCSYNAHLDKKQADLLLSVYKTGKNMILLMLRDPYDKGIIPADTFSAGVFAPLVPNITAGVKKIFTCR
ncbi:MAG: beta-N-acetylhexosaminidase [bacterium]|nr:beta-N-acetylhexosaminidase [bacterium]